MNRKKVKLRNRMLAGLLSIVMILSLIPDTTKKTFATEEQMYTINVTDGTSPIEGATVSLFGKEKCSEFEMNTTTDADGNAIFLTDEMVNLFKQTTTEDYVDLSVLISKEGYDDLLYEIKDIPTAIGLTKSSNSNQILHPSISDNVTVSVDLIGDAVIEINGSVQNELVVEKGTSVNVKITPSYRSYIKTLNIDGKEILINKGEVYDSDIIANDNVIIEVNVVREVELSVDSNEGGTVLLDDIEKESMIVDAGYTTRITAVADEGYRIGSIIVDRESISGAYGQEQFSKDIIVSSDVKVIVRFVKVYTVAVQHNENGSTAIVESETIGGTVTIEEGTKIKISAVPDEHYRVAEVKINDSIDDTVNGENDSFYEKIINIDMNYTIIITFAPNMYEITKSPVENGTIIIDSELVKYDGSCVVKVTPEDGYAVSSVKINDNEVTEYDVVDNSVRFTISNIVEKKEIKASFVAVKKADVETKELFDYYNALRNDDQTYIYHKDSTVSFQSLKDKTIKLYDINGNVIGEASDESIIPVSETKEIGKIELVYKADGEMVPMAHEVEGISAQNPLRIVFDSQSTESVLTPDLANTNGFHNHSFYVELETKDLGEYSGISTIDYFITSTNIAGEYEDIQNNDKTEIGTLYTYNGEVENNKRINIPVNAEKNNSDFVVVWVKITDRAGNVEYIHTDNMKVCSSVPKLEKVQINGSQAKESDEGYYNTTRTATITVIDRQSAFDEEAATDGINIIAKNYEGSPIELKHPKSQMVSWTHNNDVHTATIEFEEDANYLWSFEYVNKADLSIDSNGVKEYGKDIYMFTIDRNAPEASISIDSSNTWNDVIKVLSFGIWKKDPIIANVDAKDDISGVKEIVYYKSNLDTILKKNELDEIYKNGEFTSDVYKVDADEKFIVYARIIDKSGNSCYVSTNGLIYDCSNSSIALKPVEEAHNGFYNCDVNINVEVNEKIDGKDAYSGIKSVKYIVIKDDNEITQKGTLYEFEKIDPEYNELKDDFKGEITIDSKKNNSDNVKLIVTVVDNAGNIYKEKMYVAINVDVVQAKITFDDNKANRIIDGRGYYNKKRVATIEINDRSSVFDKKEVEEGIIVKDNKNNNIEQKGNYYINWVEDGDKHIAKVTFWNDNNYVWSFNYTNKAGNVLEEENIYTDNSQTPFSFTIDKKKPIGKITVKENTWEKLLGTLTFGIFDREKIDVSVQAEDSTSPIIVECMKLSNEKSINLLNEKELDEYYKEGKFDYKSSYTVKPNEQFVVYVRITDYAGNYIYICSDGAIVDNIPCVISIEPEEPNSNGVYGQKYDNGINVNITVTDQKPSSGIKSIEYKVVKDNDIKHPTQLGSLNYPDENSIFINSELNNSSNVVVYVTVTDNAGNENTESKAIDIDVTNPQIDISFDDDIGVNKIVSNRGYFAGKRVAIVKITERTQHFDTTDAINGIKINAVDAKGNPVANSYEISGWSTTEGKTPDEAVHTATITFKEDANYTWSISYKDKADNLSEKPNTGSSLTPYTFTVDTHAPTGTVKASTSEGRELEWNSLRNNLTFGIWSKKDIVITGHADDETSASIDKIEYYKMVATSETGGTKMLSKAELDAIANWTLFNSLKVEKDEQFVVYLKITDLAGNYSYICTNGLIVDHSAPFMENIAPEITVEPEQPVNGIYNGDVKVDIKVVDPLVGGTYSGLKKIWYEVRNMGEVTQGGEDIPLYEFDKNDPKQEELINNWKGSIIVNSELNNSNDIEIIVYAEDNAMNGSDKSISIKIDITKPTILVSYDNNSADSEKYFKEDRIATVIVTERNFDPKDVMVNITNTDGVIPVISEFTQLRDGNGNKDNTEWIAKINYVADGDYTFDIVYSDSAKNECEKKDFAQGTVAAREFTIDRTKPIIEVNYDNNNASNGYYYNATRTASVVITEHNFNPERVTISHTAVSDGTTVQNPTISNWSTNGDKHIATIQYDKDAKYTFKITMNDMAGNVSDEFVEESFVVDTTMPNLEITGVGDRSANKGDVIPVITYSDINFEDIAITLAGAKNKNVVIEGTYTDIHNGKIFTFDNFAKEIVVDDIYTLTVTLTDRAGNTNVKSIVFSVNRFGSTYALSETVEKLIGTYTKEPIDVVINETNADELSNIKIILFKDGETKVLTEGADYIIDVTGGNGQWYYYTYTVFAKNFDSDGVYSLTVESDDKAGNEAKNNQDTKNKAISFGVDRTLPIINIENLESKTTYAVDNKTVSMNVKDNLKLAKVVVELDGKVYMVWSDEELDRIIENGGNFTFDIAGDSTNAHNLVVYAIDAAGNGEKVIDAELPSNVEEIKDFYVTTNLWVRYYTNKPLFFGSIAGIIVIASMIVFLVVRKKRKS